MNAHYRDDSVSKVDKSAAVALCARLQARMREEAATTAALQVQVTVYLRTELEMLLCVYLIVTCCMVPMRLSFVYVCIDSFRIGYKVLKVMAMLYAEPRIRCGG